MRERRERDKQASIVANEMNQLSWPGVRLPNLPYHVPDVHAVHCGCCKQDVTLLLVVLVSFSPDH